MRPPYPARTDKIVFGAVRMKAFAYLAAAAEPCDISPPHNLHLSRATKRKSQAVHSTSPNALRAAMWPHIPWTPPPGGVDDEQRYSPLTGVE